MLSVCPIAQRIASSIWCRMEPIRFWLFCQWYGGHSFKSDTPDLWCSDERCLLWAHAGGGHLHTYSNSKEAIDYSIAHGIKVLELDVAVTADGVPVLTHWFRPCGVDQYGGRPTISKFKATPINGRFTPLSLDDLFEKYDTFDGYFSLDPYYIYREGLSFDLPRYLSAHYSKRQLQKVIYQVPNLRVAKQLSRGELFNALHFALPSNFDEPNQTWRLKCYVRALVAFGVRSVSFGNRPIADTTIRALMVLRKAGLHVSVVGVETSEERHAWIAAGADVFNSDLLTQGGMG